MRRLRPLRKDVIFRLYLGTFAFFVALGVLAVVKAQNAANARVVSMLEKRIAELEARPVAVENPEPSEAKSDGSSTAKETAPPAPLFFVLGHGYNKRYAYLDIEFNDGTWERFYFRPFPSRVELVSLHRSIEHHALRHYFPLDMEDDS